MPQNKIHVHIARNECYPCVETRFFSWKFFKNSRVRVCISQGKTESCICTQSIMVIVCSVVLGGQLLSQKQQQKQQKKHVRFSIYEGSEAESEWKETKEESFLLFTTFAVECTFNFWCGQIYSVFHIWTEFMHLLVGRCLASSITHYCWSIQ